MIDLSDLTTLVTGASRGIGAAIAEALLTAGAKVYLWDISEGELEETYSRFSERFGAEKVDKQVVDVGSKVSVENAAARLGNLDCLINNAGIQHYEASETISDSQWKHVMDVNLNGALYCSQAVFTLLKESPLASIINIASCVVGFGMPGRAPYGVSKAGVSQLTKILAAEWAGDKIRVNSVAPGYVLTEMIRNAFEGGHINRESIEAKIAMGRFAREEEIANVVLFLASPLASYVDGQTLYVDGGYSIVK